MNTPTPTPPTEAHYQVAHQIRQSSTQESAAQLIADSEARAIATQLEVVVILTRRWLNVEKERDQLRAEVERLTPYVSKAMLTHGGTMLCSPQVGVAFGDMRARAERAEAELGSLHSKIGALANELTTISDNAPTEDCVAAIRESFKAMYACVVLAGAAKKEAEAELATERARLDSGQIMLIVAGERVWHSGVDLRAAIDAGMKEGAK